MLAAIAGQNGRQQPTPGGIQGTLTLRVPAELVLLNGPFRGESLRTDVLMSRSAPALLPSSIPIWRSYPVRVWAGLNCPALVQHVRRAVETANSLAGGAMYEWAGCASAGGEEWGVEVRIGGAGGTTTRSRACDLHRPAACATRRVVRGVVTVGDPADSLLLLHELLHAVGLGDTCMVLSVMATRFTRIQLEACADARSRLGLLDPVVVERRPTRFDASALAVVLQSALLAVRQSEEVGDVRLELARRDQ